MVVRPASLFRNNKTSIASIGQLIEWCYSSNNHNAIADALQEKKRKKTKKNVNSNNDNVIIKDGTQLQPTKMKRCRHRK